jgi:Skp family chaperone for outer membrane proteins
MNAWESWYYLAPVGADGPDWEAAQVIEEPGPEFDEGPREGASFADPPAVLLSTRGHKAWAAALEDHVYRSASLNVMSCPSLKINAAPGGTESEFRSHLAQTLREKRDAAVDELRQKFSKKLETLEDRQRRAEQKLERERAQASSETVSTALSVGGSLLGALFGGRRSSALRKASTAARSVGRASKERADVAHAEADAEAVRAQIAALNADLEAEIARLEAEFDPDTIRIETVAVRPRKADITAEDMALVWCP